MKYIKMLGLAAVAAMALMAFAGTASATELYKLQTGAGPATLGKGTVIETSMTGSSKTEASGEVLETCTGGTMKFKVSNVGSATATVSGSLEELTWSGCTRPTATISLGSLEIHHIAGTTNGTVTGRATEWTINGIFGTSCAYGFGAGTNLGTLQGATAPHSHATLAINAVIPRVAGGFLCPSTVVWNTNYTTTAPTGLVVEAS
ncbi:MAG: hypothetical protein M3335_08250 [Actinomycetota bacterium]|nr:hypothetical protein [Actinomycetota bacterium]